MIKSSEIGTSESEKMKGNWFIYEFSNSLCDSLIHYQNSLNLKKKPQMVLFYLIKKLSHFQLRQLPKLLI